MATIDSDRLRQFFFLLVLGSLGILIFWHIYPFFTALLAAITFYVLFRHMMFYLTLKRKWRKPLAAMVIMLLSFIIILLPIAGLIKLLYSKLNVLLVNPEEWIGKLTDFINTLNERIGIEIVSDKNIEELPAAIAAAIPNILMATLDTIVIVALLYFVLYFMLTNGQAMERWLYEHVPLRDENVKKIGKEIYSMVLSNAIGIPLLALIQGIFALLAYWLLGVPDPVLWGTVTAFAAMLPVIGSTAVWFPLSLFLYFTGMEWQGIVLWIYGVVVIINVDNGFRIIIEKKLADVHPLITIFGVIIGVSLFGFIGLVFGPLLVSMFILLLRIYNDEFIRKRRLIDTNQQ